MRLYLYGGKHILNEKWELLLTLARSQQNHSINFQITYDRKEINRTTGRKYLNKKHS